MVNKLVITDNNYPREFLCRSVFVFILFSLTYSFFSNTLLHQLKEPVLRYMHVDLTYWLINFLEIPKALTRNVFIAYLWDTLLFSTCIGCIIKPGNRSLVSIFCMLYFFYLITFNTFLTSHISSKTGILLMPVAFLFIKQQSFNYMWEALRYYTLSIFTFAFLYKILRLSWLDIEQGSLIIKKNLTPYLYFNPDTFQAKAYYFIMDHPGLTYLIYLTGVIVEGFFIVGFFTKRFDKYLIWCMAVLMIGFLIMADAMFFELLIFSITLSSAKNINKLANKLSSLY